MLIATIAALATGLLADGSVLTELRGGTSAGGENPNSGILSVEESDTSFQVEATPSRRLRVVGSASWTVAGGADAESRLSVPLARGPQASAGLEWSASPVDRLRFEAGGADTRFSNDRRASVARFTAGWRRQLFRDTQLSFSAGPGIRRAQTAD